MRQALGPKKLRHYARLTGLQVVRGTVRGGTGHRVDLFTRDGSMWSLWPDGTLEKFDERAHLRALAELQKAQDDYWQNGGAAAWEETLRQPLPQRKVKP